MAIETKTHALRPRPPVAAWLHQLTWSRGWDWGMRLVTALFPIPLMIKQWMSLAALITGPDEHTVLFLAAAVADRVVVIIFLALFAVVILFRLPPIAKTAGPLPRLIALAGTCSPSMIILLPRNPDSVAVNTASSLLIAVGFGLTIYSFSYLDSSASIMPEARRLVTTGPYRLVRHPVYLFEQIGVFGLVLPYVSPWAVLFLAFQISFQRLRMRYEERVLGDTFAEYEDYARATRRVIPGLY